MGVLSSCILELRQDAPTTTVLYRCHSPGCSSHVAEALLREHLRLGDAHSAREAADSDAHFCTHTCPAWTEGAGKHQPPLTPAKRRFIECAAALPGVRVLRILDEWECLVTFMGSANNNIKRNMAMTRDLCAAFPSNSLGVDAYGIEHFSFPRPEQVASLAETELWELGWGYRAPRLFKLAREVGSCGGEAWLRQLAAGEGEDAARRALMQLSGVGRKVADCCLLFGYAIDSVVPVDTHCLQLAQRLLLPPSHHGRPLSAGLYTEIVSRFQEEFGQERTGHAFMQLFVAELADFRKRVPSSSSLREGIGSEMRESHGQPHGEANGNPATARGGARKGRAKRARPPPEDSIVTDERGPITPLNILEQDISTTPRRSARSSRSQTAATPEKRARERRRPCDVTRDDASYS